MKESNLIKKMNSISKKIEESKIIDNCYELAKTRGRGETKVYSSHTNLKYDYQRDNIKIRLNDGWSMMGGGEIFVYYGNNTVFYADKYAVSNPESKFNPKVDDFCILTYKPGKWEKDIKKYLNEEPRKERSRKRKLVIPEVNSKILENLENNFDILLRK
jgi:hypothetical protein